MMKLIDVKCFVVWQLISTKQTNTIVPLIEMRLRVLDHGNHSSTPILGMVGILPHGCRDYSSVVQSVERRTVNPYVTGSSPVRGAIFIMGVW